MINNKKKNFLIIKITYLQINNNFVIKLISN